VPWRAWEGETEGFESESNRKFSAGTMRLSYHLDDKPCETVDTQNLGSIDLIRKILEMLEVFHLGTLGIFLLILSVPSRPEERERGERP